MKLFRTQAAATAISARLGTLETGQAMILGRVDALTAKDFERDRTIAEAIDRMTSTVADQYDKFLASHREQMDQFRASLFETRARQFVLVIRGKGLRWIERATWPVVCWVAYQLYRYVGHARGWDLLPWWPAL